MCCGVSVGGWIGVVGSRSLGWSTPNQPTEQPGVFRAGVRTTPAARSVRSLQLVVHTRMHAPAVMVAFLEISIYGNIDIFLPRNLAGSVLVWHSSTCMLVFRVPDSAESVFCLV